MVRPILRVRATLLSALLGALMAPAALAADMDPVIDPAPVVEGPVEWGSNWYLRGQVGAASVSPRDLNGVLLSNTFPNNWTIGLGGGYQFTNWLRADVTLDYQSLYNKAGPQNVVLPCQIGAVLITDPNTGVPIGSAPVRTGCFPFVRNRTESMNVLANLYLDLGNWYGFTPYIGAGVGVNVLYQRAQINWFQGNGVPYAGVTWTDPFTQGTYMANWDQRREGTFLRVAYAFMGGVAYDVDNHWKVDLGYRFLNLGNITGVDSFNRPVSRDLISHQVRMGFRYVVD